MMLKGCTAMLILGFAMLGCSPGSDSRPATVAAGPSGSPTDKPGPAPAGVAPADAQRPAQPILPVAQPIPPSTQPAPPDALPAASKSVSKRATIVFAGGCFWCVEAVFEELDGVIDAVSGYSGGTKETANYKAVCSGTTDHAEAVRITFDPTKISYEKLLEIHFATHDPTTLNRQGNDEGPQYRSAIFYANEEEKKIAATVIERVNKSKKFSKPVVTTLEPLKEFYVAEDYHQDYACTNPFDGYIRAIAMPKVKKVRESYKDLLKPVMTVPKPKE